MTHDDAKKAVDEACGENLKKAFGVLVENLIDDSEGAKARFVNACQLSVRAHSLATEVIATVFKG